MTRPSRAHFVIGLLGVLLGLGAARAQPPDPPASYAVMTLLADRITLVTEQPTVGSHLDGNRRQEVPLPDDALDGIAAFAAEDALKAAQPGAPTSLFTTRDARLIALRDQAAEDGELPAALLQAVRTLVASSAAQRLLVLSPHRGEARIRFADGFIGSGRLAGVGFYIDPEGRVLHQDSGQRASGYVAPYAYVRASVYELATLRPLGSARATATRVITYAKSRAAVTAWDAMSGAQREEALRAVIRQAVAEAVPNALR